MQKILKLSVFLLLAIGAALVMTSSRPTQVKIAYHPKDYVVFHGKRDKRVVALTFDADMTPKMKKDLEEGKVSSWYDKKVIDILKRESVPATLFMSGMWIELYPKETAELAKNPLFELANHSYSHPAFERKCTALNYITNDKDFDEIEKPQKLLHSAAGVDNHLFRFPGGCYEAYDLMFLHKLGLDAIGWDVSSSDAFNNNPNQLVSNVINNAQNGSIILMHMIGNRNAPKTSEALPIIISNLKARGFGFVKVSELIK